MEPEVLNKLESIEGRIGGIENRLSKLEALSVAMTQKLVAQQGTQRASFSPPSLFFRSALKMLKVEPLTNMVSFLIAYLVVYEVYNYFGIISAGTSFLLFCLITAVGLTLAFRKNSETTTLLVTAVGFLTPYLFGFQAATDFAYFVYMLTLNVGLLSIAFFRRWRTLAFVSFIGTVTSLTLWYGYYFSPDKLALSLYALGVFYLIYLVVAVFNETMRGFKSYRLDIVVLIANPIWFLAGLYYLLPAENIVVFIAVAIATCAVYIALMLTHLIFKHQKRIEIIN